MTNQTRNGRLPVGRIVQVLWRVAVGRPMSAAETTMGVLEANQDVLVFKGLENIPKDGPCLITCNHHSSPKFGAWWIGVGLSGIVAKVRDKAVEKDLHWIMTAAWRFENQPVLHFLFTPLSRWFFARLSRVYGYITMPPMPPSPEETEARAVAVLRALRMAKVLVDQGGVMGLAPEGRDTSGDLDETPPGVGLFMAKLVRTGLPILPVGIGERDGQLVFAFGEVFVPKVPQERAVRDSVVSREVMEAIEVCRARISGGG